MSSLMCDARPFGQPSGLVCIRDHDDDAGHVFVGFTVDDAHTTSEPYDED